MKKMLKIAVLGAVMFGSFCVQSFAADLKIGTVDMSKVFTNYYKTVQANIAISNEVANIQLDLKNLVGNRDKIQGEYTNARVRADDQALSSDERDKSKKLAQDKYVDLQNIQQAIEQYNQSAELKLRQKQNDKTEELLKEINGVLSNIAKTKGYSLVLNTSGKTIENVPAVVFSTGENDITDAVIKELNSAAPAAPPPDRAPGAK